MTLRYETKQETRPVTTCVECTCDLCGNRADSPDFRQWTRRTSYDVSRTTVECEEGSSFPEGRHTEKVSFHICPECFKGKLIPWMESQGAKPTIKEP